MNKNYQRNFGGMLQQKETKTRKRRKSDPRLIPEWSQSRPRGVPERTKGSPGFINGMSGYLKSGLLGL